MANKLKTPCTYPGCPGFAVEHGRCEQHKRQEQRQYDRARGSAARRGYDARWRRVRAMVLAEEPLCRECLRQGRVVPATDVHHIDGNVRNMRRENLEPLCHECHSRIGAREGKRWG